MKESKRSSLQIASHRGLWTARVIRGAALEDVEDRLLGVQKNDMVTEYLYVNNRAWSEVSPQSGQNMLCSPYSRYHRSYVSFALSFGKSKRLPMRGLAGGPGGYGRRLRDLRAPSNQARVMAAATTPRLVESPSGREIRSKDELRFSSEMLFMVGAVQEVGDSKEVWALVLMLHRPTGAQVIQAVQRKGYSSAKPDRQ